MDFQTGKMSNVDDEKPFCEDWQRRREELDQMIRVHGDGLKKAVVEAVNRRAEETAARKVEERCRELEAGVAGTEELERRVAGYKAEVERLRGGVKLRKRANEEMRVRLNEAVRFAGRVEADAESSCVGTRKPVLVTCKGCRKRMANFIVMPCRHLSFCVRCEPAAAVCPICGGRRESVVKVQLPSE